MVETLASPSKTETERSSPTAISVAIKNYLIFLERPEEFINHSRKKPARPNTIVAYRNDLANFSDFCQANGAVFSDDLTPEFITVFATSLQKNGLKPITIARKLVALRGFLGFVDNSMLDTLNPKIISTIPSVSKERKAPVFLKDKEVRRLRAAILEDIVVAETKDQKILAIRNALIVFLPLLAGTLPSEMIEMTFAYFASGQEPNLTVDQARNRRAITIKLILDLVASLKAARVAEATAYLFPGQNHSGQMNKTSIHFISTRYTEDLVDKSITPRTLRNTFLEREKSKSRKR